MSEEIHKPKLTPERLSLLYQVSNVIHSTLDSQEALQLIVSEAVRVMRASSGSLALINPTTNFLEIHAAQNLSSAARKIKLRAGEGITGWVARHGKSARVGDVTQDKRYVSVRSGVCSELAVPLEVRGEVRGVLNVDSERTEAFSAADQELLQELAVQAAKVIQNTWLYEQLRLKAGLFESLNPSTGIVTYRPAEAALCEPRDSFHYAIINTVGGDTAVVNIEIVCDEIVVYSGFSPNDDGKNDVFKVVGIEKYAGSKLLIFNRWGNQVFEAVDYQNDWKGTFSDKPLPDGTYFWILDLGNGKTMSGYVQILR